MLFHLSRASRFSEGRCRPCAPETLFAIEYFSPFERPQTREQFFRFGGAREAHRPRPQQGGRQQIEMCHSASRQHDLFQSTPRQCSRSDDETDEGDQRVCCRSEGGHFGSVSQTQQPRLASQSERNEEVPTNTTTTRPSELNQLNAEDDHTLPRGPKPRRRRRSKRQIQNSTWRCTDQLHNTTKTNNDPRHTAKHTTRQPKQHAETQQQTSRNDHSHDDPEKHTLSVKRRQNPRAHPRVQRSFSSRHWYFVTPNRTWRKQKEELRATRQGHTFAAPRNGNLDPQLMDQTHQGSAAFWAETQGSLEVQTTCLLSLLPSHGIRRRTRATSVLRAPEAH